MESTVRILICFIFIHWPMLFDNWLLDLWFTAYVLKVLDTYKRGGWFHRCPVSNVVLRGPGTESSDRRHADAFRRTYMYMFVTNVRASRREHKKPYTKKKNKKYFPSDYTCPYTPAVHGWIVYGVKCKYGIIAIQLHGTRNPNKTS